PRRAAVDHRQRVLRQYGEPGAHLCAVRALDQHDARLRRDGLARSRRLVRHRWLCLHPRHRCRIRPAHGGDLRDRAVDRGGGVLRRAVAARTRPRFHHDHARARADRLGRGLPRQRFDRRRQRHPPSGAPDAVRLRHPRCPQLLLLHADRLRHRAVLHLAVLALSLRRELDGRPRPAPPHAHARPQRLADPLDHVRHGRGFWASVAGVLYVYYNLFLSPHAISLQQSAEILLMAILGGASTLTGPIVGAAIITLVKNVVSTYVE